MLATRITDILYDNMTGAAETIISNMFNILVAIICGFAEALFISFMGIVPLFMLSIIIVLLGGYDDIIIHIIWLLYICVSLIFICMVTLNRVLMELNIHIIDDTLNNINWWRRVLKNKD